MALAQPPRFHASERVEHLRYGGYPLLGVLAVSLLWRLPSWWDPPWVNDEGTYFAVAQAMAHGYRLYADVWENKPPGLYLLYTAVYHLFGVSLLAVRLLSTLAVAVIVILTFCLACRVAGRIASLTAALLCGLLFGVPFLEGTTGNAEVFLAALTASAAYLVVVRKCTATAGAVVGIACLFKSVAVFDSIALLIWLVAQHQRGVWRYAAAGSGVIAATLVVTAFQGILPAMLTDAFWYDLAYVGQGNGGNLPWLLIIKVVALAIGSYRLRRAPFPYIWLLYAAAGVLLSGRFFGHYLLQAVTPLCLTLATVRDWPPVPAKRVLWALPLVIAAGAALSALGGYALQASGHASILAERLQYYSNFTRYALGTESYCVYRGQLDDHVNRNLLVAGAVRRTPYGTLLVWGNAPWIYVLSERLPATPYTSALRMPEIPGEVASLRRSIRDGRPVAVVVVQPADPSLGMAAVDLVRRYRRAWSYGGAVVYVRTR